MNQELYKKNLQLVYSSKQVSIYQPDENGIMFIDCFGFIKAASIKEGCFAILDCMEINSAAKILNSNLKVTGHYAGAAEWLGSVWFNLLYERGARSFAWVYSSEFYTQLATDQVTNFNTGVTVQTFYSLDSAYVWLQNS